MRQSQQGTDWREILDGATTHLDDTRATRHEVTVTGGGVTRTYRTTSVIAYVHEGERFPRYDMAEVGS